ncbi:MAG: molybdenum ABC transporter ATP-binding protein [Acidobacteriota bacterium]|jgi:molybdate transport system ATP-binding protein
MSAAGTGNGHGAPHLAVKCRHRFTSGFALDLDFVAEQATTALFGPSGAGKTSLLMMIAGFFTPDEGRVAFNDHLLLDTEAGVVEPPEARRVGVVFQDQRLFPHLSVEANLRFGRRRHPQHSGAPAFERMVAVLELGGLLGRQPDTLSGGERQRVALGRALMSAPELLLLDEPVAAVDEAHRDTILRYVERVAHEWRLPMLYVSHHRAEVQRLADWVVAVDRGLVIEQGPPERVLGADAVVGAHDSVNLLRLEEPVADDGGWLVSLPGLAERLRLPAGEVPTSETVFVQFGATDVMLASGATEGLSARNRLPASVIELVPREGRVFVALRVGDQRLWAEVTSDAAHELELGPGKNVTCLIKSAALKVIE